MSKALTRLTLALLLFAVCASATTAQTATAERPPAIAPPEWVALSPAGEGFTARVPKPPASFEQSVRTRELDAFGFRHAAAVDNATTFVVWSMKGSHAGGALGGGDRTRTFTYGVAPYLDPVAELAWELLVAPELERLRQEKAGPKRLQAAEIAMTYRRGFELSGLPAREYSVVFEKERGYVYVCAEGAQVYVVAALGVNKSDARLRQFVDSFALKSGRPTAGGAPSSSTGTGTGIGPNTGSTVPPANPNAPVDYSRPFKQSEVSKKAVPTFKPEPGFTEQARRFNVTGVVRLRAILHSSGELRNITVVRGLPHGLTEMSVVAATRIRFEPAQKDGRAVSQYVVLEYNYNIY